MERDVLISYTVGLGPLRRLYLFHCDKVAGSNLTHLCSVAARGMSAFRGKYKRK